TGRIVVKDIALLVRGNMHIRDPSFSVADPDERIDQLDFAVSRRFNFCSLQYDARFNRFFDEIIEAGFFVLGNYFAFTFCHAVHLNWIKKSASAHLASRDRWTPEFTP